MEERHADSREAAALRLKTLLMRGGAHVPEGRYDPATHSRQVSSGRNARAPQARMASLHEMYHAYLNDTTGYGTCLILAGALARRDPARFDPALTSLLSQAIGCHEAFATAASVFIVSGGDYDPALLDEYPAYRAELDFLSPVLEQAPHPALAHLAIENLARAAMQTGLDRAWSALPVDRWPENSSPAGQQSPDIRFDALISSGFLKVLFRAEPEFVGADAEIAAAIKRGEITKADFKRHFDEGRLDGALDAYGHLYFRLGRHRLASLGGECLDYNGHTAFTAPLIGVAADAYGDGIRKAYRAATGHEDDMDLLIGDFAHEALVLAAERLPATLTPASDLTDEEHGLLLIGPADAAGVHIVAMPRARLEAQYAFDPESVQAFETLQRDPVTLLRRRQTRPDGSVRIDLVIIDGPDDLRTIAESWPQLERVVTLATVRALQSDDWRNTWLPIFQSFGSLPVLVDADPFQMMKRWSGLEQVFHFGRLSMQETDGDAPSLLEVMCWKPVGEDMIFLAPVSGAVAAALVHQARRWPDCFVEDNEFLKTDHAILTHALTHLIREERAFGFSET